MLNIQNCKCSIFSTVYTFIQKIRKKMFNLLTVVISGDGIKGDIFV